MAPEFAPLVALIATIVLIVVLRPLAVRVGLVDIPNERKSHRAPTPLVGGLAIFAGLVLGFFLCRDGPIPLSDREIYSFLGAGLLLVVVGVIDDFVELSPAVRIVAQVMAALLMIFGAGVVLKDLGSMTPEGYVLQLGVLAVPFTVFATLGVINALNMCDGLDGLSGSLTLTSLSGLILAAYTWGIPADTALLPILGTAIAGFLLFNLRLLGRERASVFMGDAGSMFLGLALTWYAISLSQGETRALPPAAALWFLMIPIFDAVSMMLRRIMKGRSPFAADREHLHHIFLLAGYSVNDTVLVMTGVASCGVFIGLATIYFQIPELVVSIAFLLTGIGYFWMISHAWKVMRFLRTSICRRQGSGDRRKATSTAYAGPERRSGLDRRTQQAQPAVDVERPSGNPVESITRTAAATHGAHPGQTQS
ncbi:MAG: undecaprenyl/decaprenyl-phosphate alpha-N-acetylglucosaminyl 1-phosphate transferase [Chromatiales bacterium]|nr:undecaprenyl/decaprenyl-phosphate alpha-N-acetylglucosaminyl 1-phosphate transferase [Chromatiales bacterium]